MKTRKARVSLKWNGQAVHATMEGYKLEITYTDPACGESDCIEISLHDRRKQWSTAWLPMLGDTLEATILTENWAAEGDASSLPCGLFVLDDFSFTGWPVTGKISAVSAPQDGSFSATKRTKTWENITMKEIAKEIAMRSGIQLLWDGETEDAPIKSVEQSDQTDSDFFNQLCEEYGLALKVYGQKLVIYDREKYKAKDTVGKITEREMESWDWTKTLAGTYTGGTFAYTDPGTEKEISVSIGTGKRLLTVSGEAFSADDARRKLQAAINKENHGATALKLTITGRTDLSAGQNVTVTGLGKLSGKYFIDKAVHTVGSGYTLELELSLADTMTEEVIFDAIERLASIGVIDTPSYWQAHYKDVAYLDGLILNMATQIRRNDGGTEVQTAEEALTVFTQFGVLNSPNYWLANYKAIPYIDKLVIKGANALNPYESWETVPVEAACQQLAKVGVINTPEYWQQHFRDVPYLGELLIKLSAAIDKSLNGTDIATVDVALDALAAAGIVNTPAYWRSKHGLVPYLDELLIKAANALGPYKDERGEQVRASAEKLAALGIIDTPSYWTAHFRDLPYLGELLLKLGDGITENRGGTSVTSAQAAIAVLASAGIINTPDYWNAKYSLVPYLDVLLIRCANAIA